MGSYIYSSRYQAGVLNRKVQIKLIVLPLA